MLSANINLRLSFKYLFDLKSNLNLISGPSQCHDYHTFNGSDRAQGYHNRTQVSCDDNLLPGWYRFKSLAGENMPLAPPLAYQCGTKAPGWVQGPLPIANHETVTRRVCFHSDEDYCKYNTYVNITNCGSYNVYQLANTPACKLRYCGDKRLERK